MTEELTIDDIDVLVPTRVDPAFVFRPIED